MATLDICILSDEGLFVGKASSNDFRPGRRYRVKVEEVQDVGGCDPLQTPSEVSSSVYGHSRLEVANMMQRYGLLAGWSRRTDEEEAEMQQVLSWLRAKGCEPGWRPVARSKRR